MSTIINTYPVFENSQVLTSAQLNQLVAYLDQQNRLTRVKLIGIGIVCGLELSYEESGTGTQVTISKGVAITSEGFLITLGACETSYYRPYVLPEGVQYKPFGSPVQDVTLYELLKEEPKDATDVELLSDPAGFLDDKFVLLFLEAFDNDLKSCLGQTCDDLGIDRIFTVRKLLISKTDLEKIVPDRAGNVADLYPDKFTLPDIFMPRALFNPNETHSSDYTEFSKRYADAFKNTVYPALFGTLSSAGALSQTYSTFAPLLGPEYGFADPFQHTSIVALKNTWKPFFEGTSSPGPAYRGIQYFYDFLKDLILAYNEFRQCALDLMAECCPDMSLFPRHIMLGRAQVEDQTEEEGKLYRHGFTQPPIYNHQKYLIAKTISLHKRMVVMVEKFRLNTINVPPATPMDVRITPSREKNTLLSQRSIPYYFASKDPSAIIGSGTLEQYWNYDVTRTKNASTTTLVLSYENQSSSQSLIGSQFQTPLYYNIDDFPFLRIEGHMSQNVDTVLETLTDRVKTFNLPFDLVSLQLDLSTGTAVPGFDCGFEDIQEEYVMLKGELCAFVADLFRLYEFMAENIDEVFGESDEIREDFERFKVIIESLDTLCKLLPECFHEFAFPDFQKVYKEALEVVIDFILIHRELLDEVRIKEDGSDLAAINGIIQRLSPIIYRIIDLTFYKKFHRLYYAFKRREYYLGKAISEHSVFKNYLVKNPGIDHQAGVYQGGTFILVYILGGIKPVIADFSLPYRCCNADHCVPMCDDEEEGFEFKLPPFARPDYAITLVDTAVEVNVLINDVSLWAAEYAIDHSGGSENGGQVEFTSEDGVLRYTPPGGFTGMDKFRYRLLDNETGEEDEGLVTILIKAPEPEGCYTRDHLKCWGISWVRGALEGRNIDPVNMSDAKAIRTLAVSLQETKGFEETEISGGGILSDPISREGLVKCIGYLDRPYSFSELAQRIRKFQRDRCGDLELDCTVTRVRGRVTDSTGAPLPGVHILVVGTTMGTVTDANGNYMLDLGQVGQTIEISLIGHTRQRIDICNEEVINIELTKLQIEVDEVEINMDILDVGTLRNIVRARNITLEGNPNKARLITAIDSSEKGRVFSKDELKLLTNETLRSILDDKNIAYSSSDVKDQLVDKLLGL